MDVDEFSRMLEQHPNPQQQQQERTRPAPATSSPLDDFALADATQLRRVLCARVNRQLRANPIKQSASSASRASKKPMHAAVLRRLYGEQCDRVRQRVVRLWFSELWERPGAHANANANAGVVVSHVRRRTLLGIVNKLLERVGFAQRVSPKHNVWRRTVLGELLHLPASERRTSNALALIDKRNMHTCDVCWVRIQHLLDTLERKANHVDDDDDGDTAAQKNSLMQQTSVVFSP